MTVDEVTARVQEIRNHAIDDERAHSEEDRLRDDVLKAIAAGASDAVALATAALSTAEIRFSRWCA